jgi:flagellar basal body rod protein FlgF
MVDSQILLGGGIAIAGLAAGVGLLAFAENMGERAKERGGGLSEDMSTRLMGGLLEDTEVDAVSDLSSLTEKLEAALKETGGAKEEDLKMSEEDMKRIAEEADDGW